MNALPDPLRRPPRGVRVAFIVAGLACFCAAVVMLTLSADPTPTTPTTRRLFGLWRIRHVLPVLGLAFVGASLLFAAGPRLRFFSYLAATLPTLALVALLELLGATNAIPWNELLKPRADELGHLGTSPVPHLDERGMTYQDTASVWGLPSEPVPFHYRTDRYGFRNHVDRPAAEIDTILIGDSVLVAALVPFDKTLGAELEKVSGMRVMQVALIGISPQEGHHIFRNAGLEVKGKRVIQFIFEGNDLLDSRTYGMRLERNDTHREDGHNSLLRQMWNVLANATDRPDGTRGLRVCDVNDTTYTFLWARHSFEGVENEAQVITDALDLFDAEIRGAGGTYAVVFVPDKLRVLQNLCKFPSDGEIKDPASHIGPLRAHMIAWADRTRIPFLDLTEPLVRSVEGGKIPWYWGDTHMNEIGHAVAAQALGRCLKPQTPGPSCSGAGFVSSPQSQARRDLSGGDRL